MSAHDEGRRAASTPSKGKGSSVALWSGFGVVLAALIYGGFIYPKTVRPDAGMLLEMARLHLGLAQAIPSSKKGDVHREQNIEKALEALAEVEESSPGLSITSEFRGFAHWLSGKFDDARREYGRALERAGDDQVVATRLRANLASLDLSDGKPDEAIARLDAIAIIDRNASVWITCAQAWKAKGEVQKCSETLRSGLASAAEKGDERGMFEIAEAATSLDGAIATSAFERLADRSDRARYRLAQLKIKSGDTDSATSMLQAIGKKSPESLQRWVHQDNAFWTGANKKIVDRVLSAEAKPSR